MTDAMTGGDTVIRLASLGFDLPDVPPPGPRAYSNLRRVGVLIHIAGNCPPSEERCRARTH